MARVCRGPPCEADDLRTFCAAADRLLGRLPAAWGDAGGAEAAAALPAHEQLVAAVCEARRLAALAAAPVAAGAGNGSGPAARDPKERTLHLLGLASCWVGARALACLRRAARCYGSEAFIRRAVLDAAAGAVPFAEPPLRPTVEALLPYEHARHVADLCRRASGSQAPGPRGVPALGTIGMIPEVAQHGPGDGAWVACAALGLALRRGGSEASDVEACETLRRLVEQTPMNTVRACQTGVIQGLAYQLGHGTGSAKLMALGALKSLLKPRPNPGDLAGSWKVHDLLPVLETLRRSDIMRPLVMLLRGGNDKLAEVVVRVLKVLAEAVVRPELPAAGPDLPPAAARGPGRGQGRPAPAVEGMLESCIHAGCLTALIDIMMSNPLLAADAAKILSMLVVQTRSAVVNESDAFVKAGEVPRIVCALQSQVGEAREHIVDLLVVISCSQSGAEAIVASNALPTLLRLLAEGSADIGLNVAQMLENFLRVGVPGVMAAAAEADTARALDALAARRQSWPGWARDGGGEATDTMLRRVRAALFPQPLAS